MSILNTAVYRENPRKKILLIDDDPVFCALISAIANSSGYELDHFHSLEDMGSFVRIKEYCLAMIDYDLGSLNGFEIAEYVDVFFREIPVILISSYDQAQLPKQVWPKCIRSFLSKTLGPYHIVNTAKGYLDSGAECRVI